MLHFAASDQQIFCVWNLTQYTEPTAYFFHSLPPQLPCLLSESKQPFDIRCFEQLSRHEFIDEGGYC